MTQQTLIIDQNVPLNVRQVGNGFVVEPSYQSFRDRVIMDTEIRVFQSYAELEDFLAGHFDHRDTKLTSDAEVSAR